MYDITYKGRTLRLSNRDYEQLERRFDPKRYKRKKDKEYFLNRFACICNSHTSCRSCPIHRVIDFSCIGLLLKVSGLRRSEIYANRERVYLYTDNLDGIKKVHDILLTATEVSAH